MLAVALDVDREPRHRRQPAQRERVGAGRHGSSYAIDDLLVLVRADREHARRERVAGVMLEQRRVDLALEERLVDLAPLVARDDAGLAPVGAGLHREPSHRGLGGQRDREPALADAVLGVVEREPQLGVRDRAVDRDGRVERAQHELAAVGGRELWWLGALDVVTARERGAEIDALVARARRREIAERAGRVTRGEERQRLSHPTIATLVAAAMESRADNTTCPLSRGHRVAGRSSVGG